MRCRGTGPDHTGHQFPKGGFCQSGSIVRDQAVEPVLGWQGGLEYCAYSAYSAYFANSATNTIKTVIQPVQWLMSTLLPLQSSTSLGDKDSKTGPSPGRHALPDLSHIGKTFTPKLARKAIHNPPLLSGGSIICFSTSWRLERSKATGNWAKPFITNEKYYCLEY